MRVACRYCGRRCNKWGDVERDPLALTVDHWLPVSRGGTNEKSNLVPCCLRCNQYKGCLSGDEYLAVMHDATQDQRKALLRAVQEGIEAGVAAAEAEAVVNGPCIGVVEGVG